jgi:nucleotide-binding universal stress UspA family protein
VAGAVFVVALGKFIVMRRQKPLSVDVVVDMAAAAAVPTAATPGAAIKRVLVASDGSPGAARALEQALALRHQLRAGEQIELHLLNVQRPLTGDISRFVAAGPIEDYHRERADQALADARSTLETAGLAFKEHQRVGPPGRTIAEVAAAEGCDLILMGARGLGSHTAGLVGSVVTATLEHATVPVLVMRNG